MSGSPVRVTLKVLEVRFVSFPNGASRQSNLNNLSIVHND